MINLIFESNFSRNFLFTVNQAVIESEQFLQNLKHIHGTLLSVFHSEVINFYQGTLMKWLELLFDRV
jgi:hypothetical protein